LCSFTPRELRFWQARPYACPLRSCREFGFEVLELEKIWASARENHPASRRVLEKIGMRQIRREPDPRGVPASLIYRIQAGA
jgi:[ribosomal protein S5]-alanine N-acetyltransferase